MSILRKVGVNDEMKVTVLVSNGRKTKVTLRVFMSDEITMIYRNENKH